MAKSKSKVKKSVVKAEKKEATIEVRKYQDIKINVAEGLENSIIDRFYDGDKVLAQKRFKQVAIKSKASNTSYIDGLKLTFGL